MKHGQIEQDQQAQTFLGSPMAGIGGPFGRNSIRRGNITNPV
jgi:hypothetical protein